MHKHRYSYLDGLRGIAAIVVMIFHSQNLWGVKLAHGYLALDIFFVMSGFVIASAYDRRLASGEMTVIEFIKVRLIRLYPVYILSMAVSLPLFFKTYFGAEGMTGDGVLYSIETIGLNLLMLPSYSHRTEVLFAVNLVYWSLFFELIANITYALLRRYLSSRILISSLIALGGALVVWRLTHDDLNNGVIWADFGAGTLRSFFGIFAGIALFRYRDRLTSTFKLIPAPVILTVCCLPMLMPRTGWFDSLIDITAVLVIFPLAVVCLSKAASQRFTGLLLNLGAASYPLYLFHFQARQYVEIILRYHPEKYAPLAGLITLALLIPVSIVLEKKFDEPVRRWLTARWGKPATNRQGQASASAAAKE